ncbi:caveolin-3 [Lingula anatina]|uniref:Caveolin n=1 Tax=Lingula anatina TaxID=7574 RepID=A0A1S3IXS7_LINAN|nr:caveolin-3 [Lingula anatina]|eukprot:XP_013403000.1 caveolin-3 [Lingula anatina]
MSSTEPATVAGEEVKVTLGPDDIDIMNRDPDEINQHLKVTFSDIFAEPHPTIFSFDKVWVLSYQAFTATQLWCYRILSLICGLPCAVCWGIEFACISFCNIWVCVPYVKAFYISLHCIRKIFEPFMDTFVAPCYLAMGKIFSSIKVLVVRE